MPDLAVVSTARRAQETWQIVCPAFVEQIIRRDEPGLYEAPASAILKVIKETDAGTHTLLLVGHNPGLQDLALKLIGTAEQADLARLRQKYPTAGLAVIDFDADWDKVSAGLGRLERFVTPQSLKQTAQF